MRKVEKSWSMEGHGGVEEMEALLAYRPPVIESTASDRWRGSKVEIGRQARDLLTHLLCRVSMRYRYCTY